MGLLSRVRMTFFGEPPDYDALWAELEPRLAGHRATSWKPLVADAGPDTRSHFGGSPLLTASEAWPTCGRCRRQMPLLLQLDARDLPEDAAEGFPNGLLQAFFCTRCFDYAPFGDRMLIRVLQEGTTLHEVAVPCANGLRAVGIGGWEAQTDYPQPGDMGMPDDLVDEDDGWEALFEKGYPRQGDKLLGCPYWIQDPDRPDCPRCHEPMTAIFQLDSNEGLDMMWGDGGMAHILWCRRHTDVLALVWQCY